MQLTGSLGFQPTAIAMGATTPVPSTGVGTTIYSSTAGLLSWSGSAWLPASGSQGIAAIDFGTAPGGTDTSLAVSLPGITATAVVKAQIQPAATTDHSVDEHWVEDLSVVAGNVVAGTGFTIYAKCNTGKAYGQFNVSWTVT